MSGVGRLNRIYRQRSNGVDGELIRLAYRSWSLQSWLLDPFPASDSRCFHARHFRQAPQVPVGLTELGGEERLHEIPGDGRPDGPSAHAQDVEVIVLDALLSRKSGRG